MYAFVYFQMFPIMLVRNERSNWKVALPWVRAAECYAMPLAFNFLAWVTGFSHEPDVDDCRGPC